MGTALFSWLSDQDNEDSKSSPRDPKADKACLSWGHETFAGVEDEVCKSVAIDRLPVISYQELRKLLVPDYIAVLPEKDGWGHPFEFRLARKHLFSRCVMAIRSAGSDRAFSGNRYKRGGFPPAETGQDLVWMDGLFVRWPEREQVKRPE